MPYDMRLDKPLAALGWRMGKATRFVIENRATFADYTLKIIALAIMGIFTWAYVDQRDNGRYVMSNNSGNTFVTDSKTGMIYAYNYEQKVWSEAEPQAAARKGR